MVIVRSVGFAFCVLFPCAAQAFLDLQKGGCACDSAYAACRKLELPISFDEVAKDLGQTETSSLAEIRKFLESRGLKVESYWLDRDSIQSFQETFSSTNNVALIVGLPPSKDDAAQTYHFACLSKFTTEVGGYLDSTQGRNFEFDWNNVLSTMKQLPIAVITKPQRIPAIEFSGIFSPSTTLILLVACLVILLARNRTTVYRGLERVSLLFQKRSTRNLLVLGAGAVGGICVYAWFTRDTRANVVVRQPVINIGSANVGATRRASIEVVNQSTFPVWIKTIKTSCSCILMKKPKAAIQPGETINLDFDVDLLQAGKGSQSIQLLTEPPSKTPLVVVVQYESSLKASLMVKTLNLGVVRLAELGPDASFRTEPVRIANLDGPVKKVQVTSENELPFSVASVLDDDVKLQDQFRLDLKFKEGVKPGSTYANLKVRINDEFDLKFAVSYVMIVPN